jgi:hypothetical protein
MSEVIHQGQSPADEDPILHGLLASLPQPSQHGTLEDRVLSGVFRPAPLWVRRIRAAWNDLQSSGRVWLVVGGLAVGSIIPLVALVFGVALLAPHSGGVIGFAATEILPHIRTAVTTLTASLVETMAEPIDLLAPSGIEWIGWASGGVAACTGCAWGLYRTMTPRGARK